MYASHLNQCSGSGRRSGASGTSRPGRSRRRGSPTPRRPRRASRPRVARRLEMVVERDEVERRADPRDRGDHVQPAEEQVAPPPPVVAERYDVRHRSIAIGTSSSTRGPKLFLARPLHPLAQDRDDLAPRPPVHEDDEAEAERRFVLGVQLRRARRAPPGSSSVPCSRRERSDVGAPPIAGCASSISFCSSSVSVERDLARVAERIVEQREPLDEARAALEQLGELVDAQLPR